MVNKIKRRQMRLREDVKEARDISELYSMRIIMKWKL